MFLVLVCSPLCKPTGPQLSASLNCWFTMSKPVALWMSEMNPKPDQPSVFVFVNWAVVACSPETHSAVQVQAFVFYGQIIISSPGAHP